MSSLQGTTVKASHQTLQATIPGANQNHNWRALEQEAGRWHFALESTGQGVWDCDVRANTVYYSRMWKLMRGYHPDEVVDSAFQSWLSRVHPDDQQRVLGEMRRQNTREVSLNAFEYRERHKDGHYIWILSLGSAVEWDDEGKPTRVIGTDTNITAHKAAELALKQSEAKFRTMFESTRRLIYRLECHGGIIDTNPVAHTFTGLAPEQAGTLLFWEGHWWLNDTDRERVRDAVRRAVLGEYVQFRIDQRSAADTVHMTDLSIAPIFGEGGNVVQLMAEATDVTAVRQAKTEQEQSERHWNFVLESAGQGVWRWDIAHPETQGSPRWRQIRGYGPDEPIDFSYEAWLGRLHPDDQARVRHAIEQQSNGSQEYNVFEYRERHKQGHYVWISSVGAAVEWDAAGTPIRRIGADTDITERKVAEQRVLDLSRRLDLALEASRTGVFEVYLDNDEVFWDDRLCDIAGISREQAPVHVTDLERVMRPADVLKSRQARDNAQLDGQFEFEFRFMRADGQERTMRSRGAGFQEEHGRPRLIGLTWDVTEEVALTQSLQAAKELAETRNVELERAKERIETQSLHDALTGLPNRRYLDKVLEHHADQSQQSASYVSLLHIDLDGFKQINDTLGHLAGDAMLVHVANLLRASIGPEQFAARVGGDEFIVACPGNVEPEYLGALANKIIDRIRQPVPYQGHLCRFGASIGIAVENKADFNAQRALINADVALYQAKGRGRNRHEFFSDALQEEITSTKRIADDILRGIEQNEFVPHYQPLVDARTLDVVGVEALLRWNHPIDGLLGPFRFLKIAENLDVLSTIDHLVLKQAIQDLEHWRADGLNIASASVNVTFQRLSDEKLLSGLGELNIKPGTISFEFLESIFLDEFDDTIAINLAGLRKLGISVDVDDFGTGHTSIVSLLKLSPRRFKIDRQLIDPVVRGSEHRRLVASIVDIGKSLGIGVVAEGVETMEHARILRDLGCDFLQGYAFARPMPADQIASWMHRADWRCAS